MTKDEVIAAMKECTATFGHVPSLPKLLKTDAVKLWDIRKNFGTYRRALQASGLERQGKGYSLDERASFVKWAEATRSLGKIPTQLEYQEQAKRQCRPLMRRCGGWRNVPQRMLEYIRLEHLEGEWGDVLEIILRGLEPPKRDVEAVSKPSNLFSRRKVIPGRPMYGMPLLSFTPNSPMGCAPINEAGVLFLFGAVARQLGFVVTRLQQEFPDCEALREVEPGRCQRVLIEFEFESRNFLAHGHNVEDCDLIVCWSHSWPECPLEVLELKNIVWN